MKLRSLPWVTIVLGAIAALNPIGLDFIRSTWSSEQLSRNIATPIVLAGVFVILVAGIIEIAIRWWLGRRSTS